MAPAVLFCPKGTQSKWTEKWPWCTEGQSFSQSLGTYVHGDLPRKVWGTLQSELSAHSCSGRSRPLLMTQQSAAPPCTPPTSQGGQARPGRARPVSLKPLARGASTQEKLFRQGGLGPRCGPRAPPQPRHVQDRRSGNWSGQGWGTVPAPLGLSTKWKEGSQALEGRGGSSHLSQRFPAPSQAGKLYRCAFQAGSQPFLPSGPSPGDSGFRGDRGATWGRGAIATI